MKPSKMELMVIALRARGYSECTADITAASIRRFACYAKHPRRLGADGDMVFLKVGGGIRIGRSYDLGRPMPQPMRNNLYQEGKTQWSPVLSAKDIWPNG